MGIFSKLTKGFKSAFKSIFKGIKKVFKPIGRELKKGLGKIGEFFGELGPIGTLVLSMMLPGIGTAFAGLGSAMAGATGVAGGIFGPLGRIASTVGNFAKGVYSSVTGMVSNTIGRIPGVGRAYRGFSNFVSNSLNKARQTFGLETSMNPEQLQSAVDANKAAVENVATPTEILEKSKSVEGQLAKSVKGIDMTAPESLLDKTKASFEATAPVGEEVLTGIKDKAMVPETFPTEGLELDKVYRETIDVPVGFKTTVPDGVSQDLAEQYNLYNYEVDTKQVYKDMLTPEQIESINIDDTTYFTDFQNNRVKNIQAGITDKDGNITGEITGKDILTADAKALSKPAAALATVLGGGEQDQQQGGGSLLMSPLPTDTTTKVDDYTNQVSADYRALGYNGAMTLDGMSQVPAYGNNVMNFMNQRLASPVMLPQMTTAMPVAT
jgi:hypothetical protein